MDRKPSRGLIIKPITSEDQLRSEMAAEDAANGTTKPAPSPAVQQMPSSIVTEDELREAEEYVRTHRMPKPKRRKTPFVIAAVILALLLLAGSLYTYFSMIGTPVNANELVKKTVANTSYLVPKDWVKHKGMAGYGSPTMLGMRPVAAMNTVQLPGKIPDGYLGSDATLSELRTLSMKQFTEEAVIAAAKTAGVTCKPGVDLKKTADTAKTDLYVGMYDIAATCKTVGQTYVTNVHTILGNDGYTRAAVIMATETNWNQNKAAYQKMLASLTPIK